MNTTNGQSDALRLCIAEIESLRGAMFRVYACAANGGNVTAEIEKMRDVYEQPWSVDRARAALASSPAPVGEVVGWVDVDGYVWQRDDRAEGERYMRANKRSSVMRPAYAPQERQEAQGAER